MAYEEEYNAWHELGSSNSFSEPVHAWHVSVARQLPTLKGRILEIGCGRGDFSLWMSRKYPSLEVIAVDFSASAIAIANRKASEERARVTFKVEDAQALSFESSSFDCAISCECIEHVSSPGKMAREIHRVLRPGGRFILTTENYFNGMILMWLKTWITGSPFNSGSGVQPHENFFLYWRVKQILQRSGLQVDYMDSSHFQWLMLPRTDPARLAAQDLANPVLKRICRPFGRHFTFSGIRP